MATFPILPPTAPGDSSLPDYLPARMVNEFVYCPRLFFYEWVEGIFVESKDTLEGSQQHQRVDKEGKGLPPAAELPDDLKTRAVTLSSEVHSVIAKIDLLEAHGGTVTPVDYKRGRPRESGEALEMWPSDRVQLALQAIILLENGYNCQEAIAYYSATKQRVRLKLDDSVISEAIAAVQDAWAAARRAILPPPLEDSPKCPGCSLAGICLPEETNALLRDPVELAGGQLDLFETGRLPKKTAQIRRQTSRNPARRITPRLSQHARPPGRQVRRGASGKGKGRTPPGNSHA